MATIRNFIKTKVEESLFTLGIADWHRRRLAGRVLVLAYHNIVTDGTPPIGDRGNHLPLSLFAQQLAQLRQTHEVVPLTDALVCRRGSSRKPFAVITFDDAYQGAIEHGVKEVVRQGLPATIFVAPHFLGGRSFWWDALASADDSDSFAALRPIALNEYRGDDAAIREWARTAGKTLGDVPAVACATTEAELLRVAALPGISLGSHSWSHPNLSRLPPDELEAQLTRPMTWLRERVPSPVPWIAYPYGCYNDAVMRAAETVGYTGALAIRGGFFPAVPQNRFCLPRVNIPPGLSSRGFLLRLSGLLTSR